MKIENLKRATELFQRISWKTKEIETIESCKGYIDIDFLDRRASGDCIHRVTNMDKESDDFINLVIKQLEQEREELLKEVESL